MKKIIVVMKLSSNNDGLLAQKIEEIDRLFHDVVDGYQESHIIELAIGGDQSMKDQFAMQITNEISRHAKDDSDVRVLAVFECNTLDSQSIPEISRIVDFFKTLSTSKYGTPDYKLQELLKNSHLWASDYVHQSGVEDLADSLRSIYIKEMLNRQFIGAFVRLIDDCGRMPSKSIVDLSRLTMITVKDFLARS